MSLPNYSFVAWMRQGLGLYLDQVDNLGSGASGTTGRPSINVKLKLETKKNDGSAPDYEDISHDLQLIGPGDIIGIDSRNVVRIHPERNTPNFEPNYLPFIEFYQDTFPWDYTPAGASGDKLRPWLMLLVLEESEFEFMENPAGPLDYFTLEVDPDTVFPPKAQIWAFAHVHVNIDISNNGTNDIAFAKQKLKEQLATNPDFAVARLLSPRKLSPDAHYRAFVIPAFESGRLAGLGEDPSGADVQQASWDNGATIRPDQFPVYYSWSFQTGPFGDFEYLVRQLEGRVLPPEVGYQPLEVLEDPFYDVPGVDPNDLTVMGGALKPIDGTYPDFSNKKDWGTDIANLVNLDQHSQFPDNGLIVFPVNPYSGDSVLDDPVITPPLYGKWHAIAHTIEPAVGGLGEPPEAAVKWLRSLNTDPRHRAAAGLGTGVIQENQDKYMEIAWEQVGAILEANRMLRQAQLGIEIVSRLNNRHITTLSDYEQISLLGPLLQYIYCDKSTVYQIIADSIIPVAALDPAFRHRMKPRGRVRKKLAKAPSGSETILQGLGRGVFVKYTPYADGKIGGPLFCPNPDPAGTTPGVEINSETLANAQASNNLDFGFTNPPVNVDDFFQSPNPVPNDASATQSMLTNGAVLFGYIETPDEIKFPVNGTPLNPNHWPFVPCISAGLNPAITIKDRVIIQIDADLDAIVPILAAPDYTEPMYKKLLDKDPNFILANIEAMPRNTITLLQANQEFIESYMVGLNHEMARELLWNEYPTDQRGSYFRQFWDVSRMVIPDGESEDEEMFADKLKDIKPIHRWAGFEELGEHNNRIQPGEDPPLVLAIRGEVVNRYPDIAIFAIKAHFDGNMKRVFDDNSEEKYPIYSADIAPDITFLGFDLSEAEARGDGTTDAGWFFALKQPPAGPRFGLDESPDGNNPGNITDWNDLTWQHLNSNLFVDISTPSSSMPATNGDGNPAIAWGSNAADMAYILYQVPFMLAIHATEMLPDN